MLRSLRISVSVLRKSTMGRKGSIMLLILPTTGRAKSERKLPKSSCTLLNAILGENSPTASPSSKVNEPNSPAKSKLILGKAVSAWMLVTAFKPRLAVAEALGLKRLDMSSKEAFLNSVLVRRSPSKSSSLSESSLLFEFSLLFASSLSMSLSPKVKSALTAVGFSSSLTRSSCKKPRLPVAWKSSLKPRSIPAVKLVFSVSIKKPNS